MMKRMLSRGVFLTPAKRRDHEREMRALEHKNLWYTTVVWSITFSPPSLLFLFLAAKVKVIKTTVGR